MRASSKVDFCVIGAGSAGLVAAAGAAKLGQKVVLIEGHRMGGDCLNTGCVPSKALLAAAHRAASIRQGQRFGVIAEPQIDFVKVKAHIQATIAGIAPHDSEERFLGLRVEVIRDYARFIDPEHVEVGGKTVSARYFIIATGSRPAIPDLPGLSQTDYLTHETLFDLPELPRHLLVLGGGPIGCEFAQAFRRFGSAVTLIQNGRLLPRDDAEAVALLRSQFLADGIALREGAKAVGAESADGKGVRLRLHDPLTGYRETVEGSHLLIATGRIADISALGLDAAGVRYGPAGIVVDRRLRTSNSRIYAIGDVIGPPQFTHRAAYHAGLVLRHALFRLPVDRNARPCPWVTYTDPEIAQLGASEADLQGYPGLQVIRLPFARSDRARAEGVEAGLLKVMTDRKGRILGVTIAGSGAGELLHPWILAQSEGLRLRSLLKGIFPYPTLGELSRAAAGDFYEPLLSDRKTRTLLKILRWLW